MDPVPYGAGVIRAQRQFFRVGGGFFFHCFLPTIRELTDGLRAVQASKTKNIKIARKDIFSFSFFAPFSAFYLESISGSASGGKTLIDTYLVFLFKMNFYILLKHLE